jgi:hypothetical protein
LDASLRERFIGTEIFFRKEGTVTSRAISASDEEGRAFERIAFAHAATTPLAHAR